MSNDYTPQWFDVFLETVPGELTEAEVGAIEARLPLPAFTTVLDISCGPGRHAKLLSDRGYDVTGIDRDAGAVRRAAHAAPAARFVELDQRGLGSLAGPFDAAMILWQSFGFFDSATNDAVLRDIADLVRPGGRLMLDLFHREFFEQNQGRVAPTRDPRCRSITNTMDGARLTSEIEYVDGAVETMDFELFSPDEIERRAEPFGFDAVERCAWWDENRPPSADEQRFQITFERR